MFIVGWGRRDKTQQVAVDRAVILSYAYVHLLWLFRVSWNVRYSLATLTEAGWTVRDLAPAEAREAGVDREVSLNWWWRRGLLVTLGAVAAGGVSSAFGVPQALGLA